LWARPELTVDHAKDFGFLEFVQQRFDYARAYAGMRNPELGWKRLLYVLGSPLLPPLIFRRLVTNVRARPYARRPLRDATPLILFYLCVWSLGEALGYAFGGGSSLLRVR
jgi:hypothetical protein